MIKDASPVLPDCDTNGSHIPLDLLEIAKKWVDVVDSQGRDEVITFIRSSLNVLIELVNETSNSPAENRSILLVLTGISELTSKPTEEEGVTLPQGVTAEILKTAIHKIQSTVDEEAARCVATVKALPNHGIVSSD